MEEVKTNQTISLSEESLAASTGMVGKKDNLGGAEDDDDDDDGDMSLGYGWSDDEVSGTGDAEDEERLPQSQDLKMINIARSFVILLLFTIAAVAANGVFVYAFIQEENEYRAHLKVVSLDLIDRFYQDVATKLTTAQTLSTTFTSHTHSTGATWPFVSIPDFSDQCNILRQVGEISTVTFTPLVTQTNHDDWNTYASQFGFVATVNKGEDPGSKFILQHNRTIDDGIYRVEEGVAITDQAGEKMLFPIWQTTPLSVNASEIMFNHMSHHEREAALLDMLDIVGGSCSNFLLEDIRSSDYAYYTRPRSALYYPLYEHIHSTDIVGSVALEFEWDAFFRDVMDEREEALIVVLQSSCGGEVSFEVTGEGVSYLGEGALHDPTVSVLEVQESNYDMFAVQLQQKASSASTENRTVCNFQFKVYPTEAFRQTFMTSYPMYLKLLVAGAFIFTISVFMVYDCIVEGYQKNLVKESAKTNAIVAALFPKNVRERLLGRGTKRSKGSVTTGANATDDWTMDGSSKFHTPKFRLLNAIRQSGPTPSGGSVANDMDSSNSEPLADLYPHCTIFFSDIAGFTSWSSEREPKAVFTLLETLFCAMDVLAIKMGIFKVETIGDCYVAATGLPTPRSDHAEIMVRFARACMIRCRQLLVTLEKTLGPGTAELGMRTGIHTGPVTAGILRGEKSRFQLFGDSMNTASRIESLGEKHRIHLSSEVVQLLQQAGKGNWVVPRDGLVYPKGKQAIQTYWLRLVQARSGTGSSVGGDDTATESRGLGRGLSQFELRAGKAALEDPMLDSLLWKTEPNKKDTLLIDWNTDVLCQFLADVVASRSANASLEQTPETAVSTRLTKPLDEVAAVINMPAPSFEAMERMHSTTERPGIPEQVRSEISDYVRAICSSYPRNAFHNFEHASHVSLSASKLLKRIECADGFEQKNGISLNELHSHTYGIASDSLTKFAVVFSALTHDAGHPGVANGQLKEEVPEVAERYEKCHAEQISVELAWDLLMLPRYSQFRKLIFGNQPSEGQRFRQLLVNCILATDIFDKDLCELRKDRWNKAFANATTSSCSSTTEDKNDLRATIVIEHIIQASDVSHTMQHWHIYKKWNERLFEEMYQAFLDGRQEKDPLVGWYKGEIWFFDNYIIPLALKLKDCGVFGASGEEHYSYAVANRNEWAERGEKLCSEMAEKTKNSHYFT